MSESTGKAILFVSAPKLDMLCCVTAYIDAAERHDPSAKSNFHWQILKCRQLIFSHKEIIASPIRGSENQIFVVMTWQFYKSKTIQQTLQRLNMQTSEPFPISSGIYETCLRYTIIAQIAPQWNQVDNYLIHGRDFLTAKTPLDAIKLEVGINESEMYVVLWPVRVRLGEIKLEDLNIPVVLSQQFLSQITACISDLTIGAQWVHVLPSLKRGRITSVSREVPNSCPYKTYKEIKRHWKNMYGYRLPECSENIIYYTLSFNYLNATVYTYPSICIRPDYMTIVGNADNMKVLKRFIADLTKKMPSVCGEEFVVNSKIGYAVAELKQWQANIGKYNTIARSSIPIPKSLSSPEFLFSCTTPTMKTSPPDIFATQNSNNVSIATQIQHTTLPVHGRCESSKNKSHLTPSTSTNTMTPTSTAATQPLSVQEPNTAYQSDTSVKSFANCQTTSQQHTTATYINNSKHLNKHISSNKQLHRQYSIQAKSVSGKPSNDPPTPNHYQCQKSTDGKYLSQTAMDNCLSNRENVSINHNGHYFKGSQQTNEQYSSSSKQKYITSQGCSKINKAQVSGEKATFTVPWKGNQEYCEHAASSIAPQVNANASMIKDNQRIQGYSPPSYVPYSVPYTKLISEDVKSTTQVKHQSNPEKYKPIFLSKSTKSSGLHTKRTQENKPPNLQFKNTVVNKMKLENPTMKIDFANTPKIHGQGYGKPENRKVIFQSNQQRVHSTVTSSVKDKKTNEPLKLPFETTSKGLSQRVAGSQDNPEEQGSNAKKPRVKPKIQENINIEELAYKGGLNKVNTVTLVNWLHGKGVDCKNKDKKGEIVSKVLKYLDISQLAPLK